MKMHVTGWKHSKGALENGTAYDFVTLYCLTKMEQKDNQRGAAGIDFRGVPELAEHLRKIDFNGVVVLEVETEARAKGKGQFVETAVSIAPVPAAKTA